MSRSDIAHSGRFLLDVNVLIALIDPRHVQHDAAHEWFEAQGRHAWATCALTENGVLRIVGHPRYPNCPGTPAVVAQSMVGLCRLAGHAFWSDDVSLLRSGSIDCSRLLTSAQITDTHLLALAARHGGKLASFDRRMVTSAVESGARVLQLI